MAGLAVLRKPLFPLVLRRSNCSFMLIGLAAREADSEALVVD
jgi:hypothetical protein